MHRWAMGVLAAALAALAGIGAARADTAPAAVADGITTRIDWRPCGERLECADVRVPLDWDGPSRARITIAVIRHLASRPGQKIGSLFVNFGGPGVPGVAAVRAGGAWLDTLGGGRFDVVGWDPRGTGESTAVRCFGDEDGPARFWGPDWTIPTTTAEMRRYVPKTIDYIRRCEQLSGDLLAHLSTADTARDLDHLRHLVGDRRLTYRGLSYGTFIGQTYAALFPRRVRAMILDAVVDSVTFTKSVEAGIAKSTADSDRVFRKFQQLCQEAGPARCALAGKGPVAPRVAALIERLRRGPIPAPSAPPPRQLRHGDLLLALWATLGAPAEWPELAAGLAEASDGDGSRLVRPLREGRGFFQQALVSATAMQCADKALPAPGRIRAWPQVIQKLTDTAMLAQVEGWWLWAPCASWRTRVADRFTGPWSRAAATPKPVLVIGNRYDSRTSYTNARVATRRLGHAVLLTLDGYGHTSDVDPSRCIDRAVRRYLLSVTPPPAGTVCKPDRQPFDPDFGAPLD